MADLIPSKPSLSDLCFLLILSNKFVMMTIIDGHVQNWYTKSVDVGAHIQINEREETRSYFSNGSSASSYERFLCSILTRTLSNTNWG